MSKGFVNSILGCIKENDHFGHKIELNFNKSGTTFKTKLGGSVSLVINILVIFSCGFNIN